ncbi:hypothetical protein [Natrononativus amylolyticus]|nr:hypothetical protein [Natrononativus amylolyticus]
MQTVRALEAGEPIRETIEKLLAADPYAPMRQIHGVGARGGGGRRR